MYLYINPEHVFSDSNINIYLNKLRFLPFGKENGSSENSEGYIFFHRHVSS